MIGMNVSDQNRAKQPPSVGAAAEKTIDKIRELNRLNSPRNCLSYELIPINSSERRLSPKPTKKGHTIKSNGTRFESQLYLRGSHYESSDSGGSLKLNSFDCLQLYKQFCK